MAQRVKPLLGNPASHTGVPISVPVPLLLIHLPTYVEEGPSGPCHPHGKPGWNSWLNKFLFIVHYLFCDIL